MFSVFVCTILYNYHPLLIFCLEICSCTHNYIVTIIFCLTLSYLALITLLHSVFFPAEASPGRIKYVSIVTDPTPPTNALVNAANSAVIKSKLTSSKSLGFPSNIPEDEYVEMDPIYAPVAPDEPEDETDRSSSEGPKGGCILLVGCGL